MNKGQMLRFCGLGLCMLGVLVGAKIPYFYWHSSEQGSKLISQEQKILTQNQGFQMLSLPILTDSTKSFSNAPSDGILGLLNIQALHLTAPVLVSVSADMLNVGAGHLPQSAQPGAPGTCVIAAHNATWFRHLDKLKPGDKIVLETQNGSYEYQVSEASVISTKDSISNTSAPTIALEACYPLNALYLTSKRFVVSGFLTGNETAKISNPITVPTVPKYNAKLPSDILHEGVTLAEYPLPMGTLSFTGKPSEQFTESNSPLSAVYTVLQLYLAYVFASENQNVADLNQMFKDKTGLNPSSQKLHAIIQNDPFFGTKKSLITYLEPFDVSLDVKENTLIDVQSRTVVQVSDGIYRIILSSSVYGNVFYIKNIAVYKLDM